MNLNSKTQVKKRWIIYNTTNDIIVLKKHLNVNHSIIFEKKKNNLERIDHIFLGVSYSIFFCYKGTFQEKWSITKTILWRLGFLIVKNYLPLQFMTSIWLKQFYMHLCLRLVFLFRK
jgi:hypothetical protein